VTVTCPRREYCWDCHTELSLDAAGNAVVEAMVPRAALDFAVCCELSGEPWTREEALAAAGGGDGE